MLTPSARPHLGWSAPRVRVMVCDDSVVVRGIVTRLLQADPEIEVVSKVGDGRQAVDRLQIDRPDVVLLDIEMPVMDGMTALPLLLRGASPPVVIVASALTQRGAEVAMAALKAGASDYIPKPRASAGGVYDHAFKDELLTKVKGWARVRDRRSGKIPTPAPRPMMSAPPPKTAAPRGPSPSPKVVAIGSSTGGPQALVALMKRLKPAPPVPILIVQHMPANFTAMMADHLDRLGGPRCAEARDGELIFPGKAYVAPGDFHMVVEPSADGLRLRLNKGPQENFCRPAVDPLLRSLTATCGNRLLVAILTGMGHDGLSGCKSVAAAGGQILAQDESSSVVWGMPGAVAKAGLAQALLTPEQIGDRIMAAPVGGRAP